MAFVDLHDLLSDVTVPSTFPPEHQRKFQQHTNSMIALYIYIFILPRECIQMYLVDQLIGNF